jgi:hypothetical protein
MVRSREGGRGTSEEGDFVGSDRQKNARKALSKEIASDDEKMRGDQR